MVTDYSKEFHLGEKHGFEVYYSRWAFKVDTRPCVNGLENMIRRLLEFFGMLGISPKDFKFDGDDDCCGKGSVYGFLFKVFLSDNGEDYILELWKTTGNYGYRYPVHPSRPKKPKPRLQKRADSMGVYIKGMKMPKCCDSCDFYDIILGEKPFCDLTEKNVCAGGFNPRKERMIDCPLVDVKTPHGRLIDGDLLVGQHEKVKPDSSQNECSYQFHTLAQAFVKQAPTIIGAEGKDDG